MKWRWKGTYIEAGEFGGGYEQIIIINRAGGTYKWMMKVGNEPAGLGLCAQRYRAMGSGAGGGGGAGSGGGTGSGGGVVDVVPVLVVVVPC